MLQQEHPDDVVIATWRQFSVRDFVNAAAAEVGLSLSWQGSGVDETGTVAAVDMDELRQAAGNRFDGMVGEMAREDLALSLRDVMCGVVGLRPSVTMNRLCARMLRARRTAGAWAVLAPRLGSFYGWLRLLT